MSFISDHDEMLALGCRKLTDFFQSEWKGLNRADDDFLAGMQGRRKFLALAAPVARDRRHHPTRALEALNGFRKLPIQHGTV